MNKLLLIGVAWLVLAMVLPELRPLLLVGAFYWFGGFVGGTQHRAKHDAELSQARQARGVRTVEA